MEDSKIADLFVLLEIARPFPLHLCGCKNIIQII